MKRIVVIGLGNFGSSVAEGLFRKGHEVIALDRGEEAVDRMVHRVSRAVRGDGTDLAVLREAGARKADVGIVSTGDDLTASILAVLALRDLGVSDIHVKVVSDAHARVVDKLGVTATIFPERDSGNRLAESLASRGILNHVPLGAGFSLREMAVPEPWIGETLRSLNLRQKHRVAVVAVHDMLTDAVVAVPDPDARLKDSDTLFISGANPDLDRLTALS
jgi:trk system potassium uptake protein